MPHADTRPLGSEAPARASATTPPRPFWAGAGGTVRLALPLMAAQVSVVAMSLVDTATFGLIGTAALAGGGLGALVFTFVNITAVGLASATAIQVARAGPAGHGRHRDIVRAGVALALAIGLLGGLGVAGAGPLLLRLGQDRQAVADAAPYLVSVAPALVPNLLFTVWRGLVVGRGRSGAVGTITIVGLAMKLVLNGAVLGLLHAAEPRDPTWSGLALVGLADTLTFVLMALMLWRHCRRAFPADLGWPRLDTLRGATFAEAWRLGLPIGLGHGIEAALFDGVGLLVGRFGIVALAANTIALQCTSLTFMFAVGLSQAATVRVGQAAGAGDLAEARRLGRQALALGLVVMSMSALTFGFFGRDIARLLAGEGEASPAVVGLAAQLLLVAGSFQWFDGTQNIAVGALRGLKETRVQVVASLLGYWLVGLPVAWMLSAATPLGPVGAWMGIGAGLATAAAVLVLRFERATAPSRL